MVDDLDSLPVYSYRSSKPRPLQPDVAAISTARGACPFRYAWYIEPVVGHIHGRTKLRFQSAARIVDQIEALVGEGITRFTIQDNFLVGGDRKLVALAEALTRRGVRPKHLNIFAHPDSFTVHSMGALAACCELGSIDYGVETGSTRGCDQQSTARSRASRRARRQRRSPLILFPQPDIHLKPDRYGVRRRFEGFADYIDWRR